MENDILLFPLSTLLKYEIAAPCVCVKSAQKMIIHGKMSWGELPELAFHSTDDYLFIRC